MTVTDGLGERVEAGPLLLLAHAIDDTVPAIVNALLATRSGHIHRDALVLLERPLLAHVLSLTGGNQLRAARLLGLNRNTLRKRCRELAITARRSSAGRRRVSAPSRRTT